MESFIGHAYPGVSRRTAGCSPSDHDGQGAGVLLRQAVYYLVTGVWPFVHLRSFLAVTGPKSEIWLLKTVSALIAVVGAALGSAALRERETEEIVFLAAGSAAALGTIDVVYVARRRISPVYLLDALAQAVVLAGLARERQR
jgi:hypothetical protein